VSYTLLLDLDDTLLDNPMSEFVPAYLEAISSHLSQHADPAQIARMLLAGTQLMMENEQPDCTLKEAFDSIFYPSLGLNEVDLIEPIDHFYNNIYPSLQVHTRPRPEAIQLVESAFELGYQVVIATNPIFPLTAILKRLIWAGLPAEEYPFALVPSYETFHFTKPNPAYLAELLARLGWPEGPVIMVGDDLVNDIQAANGLGIPSYWLGDSNTSLENNRDVPSASGSLADFLGWLSETPQESIEPDYENPTALLSILRSTPAALEFISRELPTEAWSLRPGSGEWCQTEIICHLRDVEQEVNLPRTKSLIQETNPFLPGRDTDPWAEERNYIEQNGRQALARFSAARQRLMKLLEKLSPQDWDRPARHAILGPTSLHELVSIIASHDRLHIHQLHQLTQSEIPLK
jgi:FMN phosphatase YigB (HAD superfamily)